MTLRLSPPPLSLVFFPFLAASPAQRLITQCAFDPLRQGLSRPPMDGFLTGTGHSGQRHRHRPLWPAAFTVTSPDSDGLARSAPLTTESRYSFLWLRLERLSTPLCRVPLIRHTPLALVAHAPTARRDARLSPIRTGPRADA